MFGATSDSAALAPAGSRRSGRAAPACPGWSGDCTSTPLAGCGTPGCFSSEGTLPGRTCTPEGVWSRPGSRVGHDALTPQTLNAFATWRPCPSCQGPIARPSPRPEGAALDWTPGITRNRSDGLVVHPLANVACPTLQGFGPSQAMLGLEQQDGAAARWLTIVVEHRPVCALRFPDLLQELLPSADDLLGTGGKLGPLGTQRLGQLQLLLPSR